MNPPSGHALGTFLTYLLGCPETYGNEGRFSMNPITLRIPTARRVSDFFSLVVLALITLSLLGQIAKYDFGHTQLKGAVPLFYVDNEASAPTWYSSAALAVAGALLFVIAYASFQRKEKFRWHWATLSALVLGLSLDEIAMIHEMPIDPMREAFQFGGALHYAWVIPGTVFVGIVGIIYLRFYLNLPRRTQILFLMAAAVFVMGAIGVEMLSGIQAHQHGEENLNYALIVTIEEFLEMLGVVILIRALVEYIEAELGGLQLRIGVPSANPIS